MADQLHADAIQQLEIVLLGSLAAEVMDILSASLSNQATVTSAQPHPYTFTSTPLVPPLASVLLEGITELISAPITVTVGSSEPAEEVPVIPEASKTEISEIPMPASKMLVSHHHPSEPLHFSTAFNKLHPVNINWSCYYHSYHCHPRTGNSGQCLP